MTDKPTAPETPELDKRKQVIDSGATETLTDFVEWMQSKGYAIVRRCEESDHKSNRYCAPCSNFGYLGPVTNYGTLFAEHFELNETKIEAELRSLLEHQRALNDWNDQQTKEN